MADQDLAVAEVRDWLRTVQSQPAPELNLDELLHTGRRRRLQRRVIEGLAGAAAVVVLAGGAFAILGGSPATRHDVIGPGPTPTATQTTPAAEPLPVPGYTYRSPALALLDGFDLDGSVYANEAVSGVDIQAAAIHQVVKAGDPQQILLLQYEFKWPRWSSRGLSSDIASAMTTMPVSEGFANPNRGVAVQTVTVAGKPVAHFSAGNVFYAWTDKSGVVLVSGTELDATRAFVAAYINAEPRAH